MGCLTVILCVTGRTQGCGMDGHLPNIRCHGGADSHHRCGVTWGRRNGRRLANCWSWRENTFFRVRTSCTILEVYLHDHMTQTCWWASGHYWIPIASYSVLSPIGAYINSFVYVPLLTITFHNKDMWKVSLYPSIDLIAGVLIPQFVTHFGRLWLDQSLVSWQSMRPIRRWYRDT